MPYLGTVLPKNKRVSAKRFREVALILDALHRGDFVHGDIHLDNLILGGDAGKVIDFDLAGKAGEATYPCVLLDLPKSVGERHGDVKAAIAARNVGRLKMQKEHDWFSFAGVLKLFEPTEEYAQFHNVWKSFLQDLNQLLLLRDIDFEVEYKGTGGDGEMKGTVSPIPPAN